MKNIGIVLILMFMVINTYSQTAEEYYNQGMEKAYAGKLEEAINLLDKSIELNEDEYVAWYNRGMAKAMLKKEKEAIEDFNKTIELYPDYKKVYLNRGTSRKHLTDYDGALADYNKAIELDTNYTDGYYNRGLLYELLNKIDLACLDFNKSLELGFNNAQKKVDKCNDTTSSVTHSIIKLTEKSTDKTYGFTSENPIKSGTGPNGGPANQRAYMDLLRDAQGNPVKYERLGSCCSYKSENGFLGLATLDRYEITYKNEKGKKKKVVIYLSFYDFETPEILVGFKTIE